MGVVFASRRLCDAWGAVMTERADALSVVLALEDKVNLRATNAAGRCQESCCHSSIPSGLLVKTAAL